jgi:hypothetical protein
MLPFKSVRGSLQSSHCALHAALRTVALDTRASAAATPPRRSAWRSPLKHATSYTVSACTQARTLRVALAVENNPEVACEAEMSPSHAAALVQGLPLVSVVNRTEHTARSEAESKEEGNWADGLEVES